MNFSSSCPLPETGLFADSFLLSGLDASELAEMSGLVTRRCIPARTTIFHQGDPGNRMFSIISGNVKVSILSNKGREAILAILGKGEFFGENALFDYQERSATVTSLEPTELLEFDRVALFSFLLPNPRIVTNLLIALSRRLRLANAVIEDGMFLDLPSRLAKKLLALARDHGRLTAGGLRIEVALTQQEFATLVGAARESVNRLLRSWEEQGVIAYDEGYISITDQMTLEAWRGDQ